jgi:hypothetical protein
MLPLSTKDKIDIIWRLQAGLLSEGDLRKTCILELSFIKNILENK